MPCMTYHQGNSKMCEGEVDLRRENVESDERETEPKRTMVH